MADSKRLQRLELTWIGKDKKARPEPRILLEDSARSYHAPKRVSSNDIFDNKLIFGDNLLALKALEQEYTGKVKCIYIDPPYNTGNAFEYYDDGLEHSIWLGLMRDRLMLLRNLLAEDGTIFIQIDDNEQAYLRVLMDELFGRSNFINQISVEMKMTAGASGGGEDKRLKKNLEYILIYSKNIQNFPTFNEVLEETDLFELIEEMREDGKSWKYTRVITSFGKKEFFKEIQDGAGQPIKIFKHFNVKMKAITDLMKEEKLTEEECYFKYFDRIFRDTNAQSSIRTRVMEANDGHDFLSIEYFPISGKNKNKLTTLYYKGLKCDLIAWLSDVAVKKKNRIVKLEKIGTYWSGFPLNNLTKEGGVQFPQGKKPEGLIAQILALSTNPNDLVLDSFAGSGTTGAVAHKMGRRWIMVELGEHAHTHIIPRMRKVIDGTDQGGISKALNWKGGGGFRYYKLAPSLIVKDKYGFPIMSKEYNPEMLAEAVCKLMGYRYKPSDEVYWIHGEAHEGSYIYITTQSLSSEYLRSLSDDVGDDRTLRICCGAFSGNEDDYPNLIVNKIPSAVLKQCEWGKDDYSLNVANLPMNEPEPKNIFELMEEE